MVASVCVEHRFYLVLCNRVCAVVNADTFRTVLHAAHNLIIGIQQGFFVRKARKCASAIVFRRSFDQQEGRKAVRLKGHGAVFRICGNRLVSHTVDFPARRCNVDNIQSAVPDRLCVSLAHIKRYGCCFSVSKGICGSVGIDKRDIIDSLNLIALRRLQAVVKIRRRFTAVCLYLDHGQHNAIRRAGHGTVLIVQNRCLRRHTGTALIAAGGVACRQCAPAAALAGVHTISLRLGDRLGFLHTADGTGEGLFAVRRIVRFFCYNA